MNSIRIGFTVIEMVVVMCCLALLMGLLIPAVLSATSNARRMSCQNKLHQLALACHLRHQALGAFPSGTTVNSTPAQKSWLIELLPYLEQNRAYEEIEVAIRQNANLFDHSAHQYLSIPMPPFLCSEDGRINVARISRTYQKEYAFTSFLGNSGKDFRSEDGLLYQDSNISLKMILDGSSNTLLVGERPPSDQFDLGWWYTGVGTISNYGVAEHHLGILEGYRSLGHGIICEGNAPGFVADHHANPCADLHFWSLHGNGGNFIFADASVRFVSYGATDALLKQASRNGGEIIPGEL